MDTLTASANADWYHGRARLWRNFFWATNVGLGALSIAAGILGLRATDPTWATLSSSISVAVGFLIKMLASVDAGALRKDNETAGDNYEKLAIKLDQCQTEDERLQLQEVWFNYITDYESAPSSWIEARKFEIQAKMSSSRAVASAALEISS